MQSINVAVLNPAVLSVFFGTGLVSLAFGDRGFRQLVFTCKPLSPCRALLYIVGSLLVTIMFNVPPNNRLKAVSAGSPEAPICGAHI
jgi:uncharacterized membrane protein